MRKICIVHSNMELGGAETSLLGLLYSIDYSENQVDLLLLNPTGELMPYIPDCVRIVDLPKPYAGLVLPIKNVFRQRMFEMTAARLLGKIRGTFSKTKTYTTKQYVHYYALRYLPKIEKKYDIAISFIDPHFIVEEKIDSYIKLGWMHTDFSRIEADKKIDRRMWAGLDHIVHISRACKEKFDEKYPEFRDKSIVIENILAHAFISKRSNEFDVENEIPACKDVKLLSIGRFCTAKNFDNVPEICKQIREQGLDVTWYLIGYGGDEALIRQKIQEHGMEEHVIILGKKSNPYPYIKACDVYIQPSRYEGKCVAVREAQMLGKPVVITSYATSASQLEDGVDGVIVPMDNEGCAKGIADVLQNPPLMKKLRENCKQRDYSNAQEVEKLYQLMKG